MTDGLRDSFIENDVIGNFAIGSNPLGSMASKFRRKKNRKHRKSSAGKRRKSSNRRMKRHRTRRVKTRSSGGIKYTKNGQPYKILANGRARFIKGRRRK